MTWTGFLPSLRHIGFYYLARCVEILRTVGFLRSLLDGALWLLRAVVLGVTPSAALEMKVEVNRPKYAILALSALMATFIFSFVFNGVFSYIAGTLRGSDDRVIYFLQDFPNIAIYTIIAPLYIMFSVLLIYAVGRSVTLFPGMSTSSTYRQNIGEAAKMTAAVSLAIVVSGAMQVSYYYNSVLYVGSDFRCKKECMEYFYWFVDPMGTNRVLNVAGIYYLLAQFLRLVVILLAAFAFATAAVSMLRAAFRIGPANIRSEEEIAQVKSDLIHFSIVEMWAKGLVAILHVHFNVWKSSCLSGTANITLARIVLAAFCFTILALPRVIAEYRIFRTVSAMRSQPGSLGHWQELTDGQDTWTRWTITLLFWTIITISVCIWYWDARPRCLWGVR